MVAQVADEVCIMYAGRVVERGYVRDIFHDAKHPYTRDLLNAMPRLGNLSQALVAIEGNVPGLYDMPSGCRFHPRCTSLVAGTCNVKGSRSGPDERIAHRRVPSSCLTRCHLRRAPARFSKSRIWPSISRSGAEVCPVVGAGFSRRWMEWASRSRRGETLGLVGESGSGKTTVGPCRAASD